MLPSFGVTCLMITAMGVLPYYVRYGMSGDQPRVKDTFERYKEQQSYWESVRGGQAGRRAAAGVRLTFFSHPPLPPPFPTPRAAGQCLPPDPAGQAQ